MKPTTESILRSFHSSGKRHLLLTGPRGCGKTTRFLELAAVLTGDGSPGLTTWAVPRSCAMLRENLTGRECVIGRFNGRIMEPTDGLSLLGVCAVDRALDHPSPWAAIDELGYLESSHPQFQTAVGHLFDQKQVLAVVRKQDTAFLTAIRNRPDVFVVDVETQRLKVGCVIMASGLSQRFGSNKLLADFHGTTLIQRILDTTDGLFDQRVVVTRTEEVEALCRQQNVNAIFHSLPHRSDTVRLGTEALRQMDAIVFCPADQPLLRRESLETMLTWPWLHEDRILRMASGDLQGAPVLFGHPYFEELCTLPEKQGGGYLARKYADRVLSVQISDPLELTDADTPEALQFLSNEKMPHSFAE